MLQALLGDPRFLEILQTFDKDNIPHATIERMQPYMAMDEFNPETVKKASKAAYGLCSWARAMESYDRVAKVVGPKKIKLEEAQAEVAELLIGLKGKQDQLRAVRHNILRF